MTQETGNRHRQGGFVLRDYTDDPFGLLAMPVPEEPEPVVLEPEPIIPEPVPVQPDPVIAEPVPAEPEPVPIAKEPDPLPHVVPTAEEPEPPAPVPPEITTLPVEAPVPIPPTVSLRPEPIAEPEPPAPPEEPEPAEPPFVEPLTTAASVEPPAPSEPEPPAPSYGAVPELDHAPDQEFRPLAGIYPSVYRPSKLGFTFVANAESEAGFEVRIVQFPNDARGARLLRRIRALASEKIPYAVSVLEYGTTQNGLGYVEDNGSWQSLREVMSTFGALDDSALARLAVQLGEALKTLSARRIVHRNISPDTILVNSELSSVKLRGFEFAAKLPAGEKLASMAGVLGYMAPEVVSGGSDCRADVYSVGASLFEALTGKTPCAATTPEALIRFTSRTPTPRPSAFRPGIPPAIDQAVFEALAPDPADRRLDTQSLESIA